jgi:hypothetical protein
MSTYPADCEQRKLGSKGCKIFHYILDTDHWEYKQETGNDVGRDCILELSENNQWRNHKVEGQIKGKAHPKELQGGEYISFPMEVKTINYAIQSPIAFVLFVVDTSNEIVYYQPIQEYLICNPDLIEKLSTKQQTINIRIPKSNTLPQKDKELQTLASIIYRRTESGLPEAV